MARWSLDVHDATAVRFVAFFALVLLGLAGCDATYAKQPRQPDRPVARAARRPPVVGYRPDPLSFGTAKVDPREVRRRLAEGEKLNKGTHLFRYGFRDGDFITRMRGTNAIATGALECRDDGLVLHVDRVFLGRLPRTLAISPSSCGATPAATGAHNLFLLRAHPSSRGPFHITGLASIKYVDDESSLAHLAALRCLDEAPPQRAARVLVHWLKSADAPLYESALAWLRQRKGLHADIIWSATGRHLLRLASSKTALSRARASALGVVEGYGGLSPETPLYEQTVAVFARLATDGDEHVAKAAIWKLAGLRAKIDGKPFRLDGTVPGVEPEGAPAPVADLGLIWATWVARGGHRPVRVPDVPETPRHDNGTVKAQSHLYASCEQHLMKRGGFRGAQINVRIDPNGQVSFAKRYRAGPPNRDAYLRCMEQAALNLRFEASRQGKWSARIFMSHARSYEGTMHNSTPRTGYRPATRPVAPVGRPARRRSFPTYSQQGN